MRKALDLVGLPILSVTSGKRLGEVQDLLFNTNGEMLGLVSQEGTWLQEGMYIPFQAIHAVGEDYLTVHTDDAEQFMRSLYNLDTIRLAKGNNKLKGKTVITESGEQLGRIEDVYFAPNWEKLVGYELSNGWITDLTEGRKRLTVSDGCIFGQETLIVPDSIRIQA